MATIILNNKIVPAEDPCIRYSDRGFTLGQGYDEAILLNTASNIADGALPGVVRSILLTEFNQFFRIIEKTISPEDLLDADEVFLTNALMGVKSVSKVNTKDFSSFVVANNIRNTLREMKCYI